MQTFFFLIFLKFYVSYIYFIHKSTPVIFATMCNALNIKDLKLDHVFNESVKHEVFHVAVICN